MLYHPFRFDTTFRKKVRQLKSPLSQEFDPGSWAKAAAEADNMTGEDARLMFAALWLASEANGHRGIYAARPLPQITTNTSMTLAIAVLNQQCDLMAQKAAEAHKAAVEAGATGADYLTHMTIKHGGPFETDVASFTDAIVDATDSWLYEVEDKPALGPDDPDLGKAAGRLMLFYSSRRSYFEVWQQVLWENFEVHVGEDKNSLFLIPANGDLKIVLDACDHRNENNAMGYAWVDLSAWPLMSPAARRKASLARTVVSATLDADGKAVFHVAQPATDTPFPPSFMLMKAQLDISYLSGFMDRPFPNDPTICLDLLTRARFVVRDLAETLAKERPEATFENMANIRAWALSVTKTDLNDVVGRALELTSDHATRVVDFLVWRKGNPKGLWAAPIVPLPVSDDCVLAMPVFESTNMVRTAESWLAKGGLDDNAPKSARGDVFERVIRAKMREALARNTIVTDGACAENAIKRDKNFPEEIDLLIQFGSLLLVGEVKCFSFPADTRERYNHLRKLRDACAQAVRKAAAIAKRPDVAAKALGISEDKVKALTILPITMVNQGYGVSLEFDGCVVTDARILDLYLGSGSYDSDAAIDTKVGGSAHLTLHLYRTPEEAVERFAATMRKPPGLQRFIDRLTWTSMQVPTSKDDVLFRVAHTQLNDGSPETKKTHQGLTDALNNSQ